MRRGWAARWMALWLAICLAGCGISTSGEPTVTLAGSPTAIEVAATPVVSSIPTVTPMPSPSPALPQPTCTCLAPTRAPTREIIVTGTPAGMPSATAASTPTITATFSPNRLIPATLMLHRRSAQFDSVQFLRDFVQILKENDMEVVTYQAITAQPDITALKAGKLVILTIDDIQLQAPLEASIAEMITILQEAGYPAVLGVITEGRAADPQTAQTLKDLAAQGWEIAAHTDTHQNLYDLEGISPGDVRDEIRLCREKIFQAVGVQPITLILPEGQMVRNARLIYKEGITWAVGIVGGSAYDATDLLIYVGREAPYVDAATTFRVMMARFNGK